MEQNKVISSNLLWRLLERFGAQGVTFIVSIILARILDPEVYGTIALITIIISILQVFVDSGLGVALIQKKDADDLDFSTVFFFNCLVCILLYIGLFCFAPYIALFYNKSELVDIIRVLGLVIIMSGIKNIQNAYVSREMMFKKYFFSTLGATLLSAIVGIAMAYGGYGVWALVFQNLSNQLVGTVILWFTVQWRPKKIFSFTRLKVLLSFGWKLLLSSLLDTLWNQLRQLIIGKNYSAEDLAYYNKGNEYPYYATAALNSSIDSVLLPVMSKKQDDQEELKVMTRRAIKISSFVLWPMMMGLVACAKPLVILVLTEKWLPCVPYLTIFCIVYAFYPIHTANLNAIKALGRTDLFLILEILKKMISLIIIFSTMQYGPFWLAFGSIIGSVLNQIINSWPNRTLLDYKYEEQLCDIGPYILMSCAMTLVVYSINFLNLSNVITLLIQIPLGVVLYVCMSIFFNIDAYRYCINLFKELLLKRRNTYE